MMESRKEKMNKNFTVVNLPFRVKKVSDKTLESIKKVRMPRNIDKK